VVWLGLVGRWVGAAKGRVMGGWLGACQRVEGGWVVVVKVWLVAKG